jgi:flavin-dependent dehydrogenase
MNTKFTYDVVIIGAGVAGCATAIALKNQNPKLQIVVLERDIFDSTKQRIGETLPPQASQQLQQLGIWEKFVSCGFLTSYGTSSAWGSSELNTNEFLYSPFGYGWHLDRAVFDQFMINEAKLKGVSFLFETSCSETEKKAEKWILNCISNQEKITITSKFVVDASGKKAAFSTLQGVSKITKDQLVGIYRYYDLNHQNKSFMGNGTCVETDELGWWYSATLPNNVLIVSYMTDADIANKMQLRKIQKLDALVSKTNFTNKRIQGTTLLSEPKVVAAQTQYLSSSIGNSWLAVGDAASSYDPIASLGIFKSLAMSRFAAFAILNDLNGDTTGLQKYQRIVNQYFEAYETKKKDYYNQENRFTKNSFWKRRQVYNQLNPAY